MNPFVILLALLLFPFAVSAADIDGDSIPDWRDNCVDPDFTASSDNPDQVDVNYDGVANTCDTDYNSDNFNSATADFGEFVGAYGSTDREFIHVPPIAGTVAVADFGRFTQLLGTDPRDLSALPCANNENDKACYVKWFDYDGDHTATSPLFDNCIGVANGVDEDPSVCSQEFEPFRCVGNQIDSNGDGYGDACDADFDDNDIVDTTDRDAFISAFFRYLEAPLGVKAGDEEFDMNSDNEISNEDLQMIDAILASPYPRPGPSDFRGGCTEAPVGELLVCP